MICTFTVLTYNIHHGEGSDGLLDLERVADVIRAESPSIVTLQELDRYWDRSALVDQPRELALFLDMDVVYSANVSHNQDGHSSISHEYGTATLSASPIVCSDRHLLPVTDGWEPRGVLITHIDVPEIGEIAVVNVHLQSNASGDPVEASKQRRGQATAIADLIRSIDVPVLVMGDFNTEVDRGELEPFLDIGLRDVWAEVGKGPGFSRPSSPGSEPLERIDLILASREVQAVAVSVVDNELSRLASDHFPIVAEVLIEGHSKANSP